MTFERMFLSNTVLIPLVLTVIICIILTFFPLVGTLGFEYAAVTGFVLAFVSVFISAELIDKDYKTHTAGRRLSDRISSVLLVNLVIVGAVYLIGIISSLIKGDCNIKEGSLFFLLIPVVTVFFSASLGFLTGYVFGKRGFFAGALIIIGTVIYSLWRLYSDAPLFVYNPVFGFFPGPIYDEVLPVTLTLVTYRIVTALWGMLFLLAITTANGLVYRRIGVWDLLKLIIVCGALILSYSYKHEIGFSYSRGYITERILPASIETDHFIIYYDPGSLWAEHIDLIAGDHEWRYRQLAEYLDVNSGEKIRSYVYPDTDIRKKVVGAGDTTIANPIHKEIHMVYDSFPQPILKHELTHVMAVDFGTRFLKMSPSIGLLEGLAVAADWDGDGYTRHQWAKSIIEKDMALPISDITGFGFWYAPPAISYTLMGSFSRYLIDKYGIDKFKTVYRTGDFAVYGKSLDDLASEWKTFLESVDTPPEVRAIAEARFGEPSIFGATCPRRVAALKEEGVKHFANDNYHRAGGLFEEALSYNGADPVLLNGLAYSLYYEGSYEEAARIAGSPPSIPEVDKTILENLRANALWQSGNTEQAEAAFKAIRLKFLPDDLKRELDIKISAIREGGEVEERIREFFSTRDKVRQAATLQELTILSPEYSPAYYLLGRMFFNNGDYKRASSYLTLAEYLGLQSDELSGENLRILGTSLFAVGDYGRAEEVFKTLASSGGTRSQHYALDFAQRARWAKERQLK